ncbi:MAG TPA: prolyl oligopeptidase family serine peptidase [Chloroflexota bacterium]
MRMRVRWVAFIAILALIGPSASAAAVSGPVLETGSIGGAAFRIEIPDNWNGTLVLYSHGYVTPGSANPARDVGDVLTGAYLLSNGYALAGSSYSTTGWAIKEALHDQIALLDYFGGRYGIPDRTVAWGHSLGGMITAALVEQNPDRFDAALPMCGVVAGGVGVWNSGLDGGFVFKTLTAPNSNLQLVHITDPSANLQFAQVLLAQAQATPQGRARIALAAAMTNLPGWIDQTTPEPAANDFVTRELNQFLWNRNVDFPFGFALRAELEARAHGNPSWNTGVDYRALLAKSVNRDEVTALYAAAGLDLEQDLQTLDAAPRIAADLEALRYLANWVTFGGDIHHAVLTMHTTGDGLVLNQDEEAYGFIVRAAGHDSLLRQTYIHRAGHCTFTPAETIAAFSALVRKMNTHQWSGTSPEELNAAAQALGPAFNLAPAAYFQYTPAEFPRPFDRQDAQRAGLN